MNERDIDVRVLGSLRAELKGAVVIKHNDVGTVGIPDIQVIWWRDLTLTSWAELKLLRKRDTLRKINKSQQLIFCHELAMVCQRRSWVVIFEEEPHRTTIWEPAMLFRHLWPNVAGPDPDHAVGRQTKFEPVDLSEIPDANLNLNRILRTFGAFGVPGWQYDIVTRLIKDATPHG